MIDRVKEYLARARKLIGVGALAAGALALAGCGTTGGIQLGGLPTQSQISTFLANANVVICDISAGAAIAAEAEVAIKAGASVQGTTGKVYTVSSLVCNKLGGVATSSASVPAGQAVVTQ